MERSLFEAFVLGLFDASERGQCQGVGFAYFEFPDGAFGATQRVVVRGLFNRLDAEDNMIDAFLNPTDELVFILGDSSWLISEERERWVAERCSQRLSILIQ